MPLHLWPLTGTDCPARSARLVRSKSDYLDLYARLKDMPLAIPRETGTLLYMLARSAGARTILEFGTSFGISILHLAAALRDNGGGRLITAAVIVQRIYVRALYRGYRAVRAAWLMPFPQRADLRRW